MIRVVLPQPPTNYLTDVRMPGQSFLRRNPNPNNKDFRNKNYWRHIHTYLYDQKRGICMYCSSWTPRYPQSRSSEFRTAIDHYQPKDRYPHLAYTWNNFRLIRARLNRYKSSFEDVLDQCKVSNDWFHLDFTSFLITPSNVITINTARMVNETIDRLQLNIDNDYVHERISVIREYSCDNLSFNGLSDKYPFIAYQMRKQNFDQNYKARLNAMFQHQIP